MAPGPSTRKQDAAQSKRKKTEVVTHVHNFLIANIFPDQAEVPSHQIDETISTFVDRISDDHRRCYRQGVLVKPPSPVKRQRQADAEAARRHNISATFTLSPNTRLDARYQMETERDADDEADTVPHPPKRKREPRVVQLSDKALARWRTRRDKYLWAILQRAGNMDANLERCPDCKDAT
ncbi:hypothetical protein C8J57DRAFT_1533823 [Mycena rebaudengoi]|nr:hypothetical protein C8J57DRAFT_1533823 [Mycena rebaudengoi]